MELLSRLIKIHFSHKGQTLVELLIAIGIMAVILPALVTGFAASRGGRPQMEERIQAIALLKETEEAVRTIRESGWSNFAQNGTFHPVLSGSTYSFASGSGVIDTFTQTVVISDVYRENGAIVSSGGSIDPSTKKVVITIDWGLPFVTSLSSTVYLTRYLDNATYTETTQTQFNAGTKTGVTVQATVGSSLPDDGEIQLGAGGKGDWCAPTLTTSTVDLPGQGIGHHISAIEGRVFTGTGENASGLAFADVSIDNGSPPQGVLEGTYDGAKTNAVFGEEGFGYMATDTNSEEVVIIQLSATPYSKVGYFDAPGNGDASSIYVVGNIAYTTIGNKLYTFTLAANRSGAQTILDPDGTTLAGVGTNMVVVGEYAYITISGSASNEMQIVNVSNPNNLQVVGSVDVNSQSGVNLFVNATGTRAYMVTDASATQNEFFIINIENKNGSRGSISSFDLSGMDPQGVTVVPGNRAIVVGFGGNEYQVFNIANESSIVSCGSENVDSGINGVASVLESDGDAYSYLITLDANNEFRIIEGGPGGSYATNGIFESATFNPGYMTANNRFTPNYSLPAGTSLQFQVSMAVPTGGVCPSTGSYTFVGPDGTTSTYFTPASGTSITYPFTTTGTYTNPGQCFRYRAYFSTSNGSSTPVLTDVTINYSP